MLNLGRIQKTTLFVVIALAALGAVGGMTTMITTATAADAHHPGPIHPYGCPSSDEGGTFICPPAPPGKGIVSTPGHFGFIPSTPE